MLNSFPIITLGCVLGALIGALIATRQPRNPIGLAVPGGSARHSGRLGESGVRRPGPAGRRARPAAGRPTRHRRWHQHSVPAGRCRSSRRCSCCFRTARCRRAGGVAVLWALPVPQVAIILSTVLVVPIDSITRADELSPLVSTVGAVSTLVSVLLLLLSLVALGATTSPLAGEQRQQLRWLTAAAFALVAGFVLANLARARQRRQPGCGRWFRSSLPMSVCRSPLAWRSCATACMTSIWSSTVPW